MASAVFPFFDFILKSAPCKTKYLTQVRWPFLAATCRGVQPDMSASSTSPPCWISNFKTSRCPLADALWTAVEPDSSNSFGLWNTDKLQTKKTRLPCLKFAFIASVPIRAKQNIRPREGVFAFGTHRKWGENKKVDLLALPHFLHFLFSPHFLCIQQMQKLLIAWYFFRPVREHLLQRQGQKLDQGGNLCETIKMSQKF